jgi:hypothetical protein
MAALTSGSWTIAFISNRLNDTRISGKKKYVDLKLTLASGEVSSGGVTMPNAGSAGLVRNLERYMIHNPIDAVKFTTAAGRAVQWIYSATANKLVPYKFAFTSGAGTASGGRALRPLPTAQTIASQILYVTAVGW